MPNSRLGVDLDIGRIDAIFDDLDPCHRPGAAVGIAVDGRPVYRKGFGLARMEPPEALSPAVRMRIFSISKHFTSLAYMLLCEENRANIDDRIGTYLPELHPVGRDVTLRQLMGNTGGLRDVFDISWQLSGTGWSVPSTELLSVYRDLDDINAAPGTAWIYNNGGFLMLSVAIERITGQSLEDVLRERIFEPAGMSGTLLHRFDSAFVPNSAALHMVDSAGNYARSSIGEALAGEGGIVSTIDDMLLWLAHMDAPRVGSATTWNLMKAPQKLANGTSTGYGLGLFVDQYRGVGTIHHAGGGMGGSSHMVKVPSAGLDVVIMTNREDAEATVLAEKVLDSCLTGLEPVAERPRRPPVVGIFRSPSTGRVLQLFGSIGHQVASIDGMDMPVEPDGNRMLQPIGLLRNIKQSLTLAGDPQKPTSVQIHDFGAVDTLVPTRPAGDGAARAIVGRYRSDASGTAATISMTAEEPRLATVGRFGSATYSLECLADGIWRARSAKVGWLGGILSFDTEDGTFRFSTYRTRALAFHRV